jgi:GNAT superfamily N-acetyltransferase
VTPFRLEAAQPADAAAIAALRSAVADDLTVKHGEGHWSHTATEKGVRADMRRSTVYVARDNDRIVATLALTTRKPWAIDRRYFSGVKRPSYMLSLAVAPPLQGQGIGRQCIEAAKVICREWPADALCLDAYDTGAGAGEFYHKCGFTEVGRGIYRNMPLIFFEMMM